MDARSESGADFLKANTCTKFAYVTVINVDAPTKSVITHLLLRLDH